MSLALATNIPFSVWITEDDQTITTALTILSEQADKGR